MGFEPVWTPINTLAGEKPYLSDCPFCDEDEGKPHVWRKKSKSAANGYHYHVKCLNCDCLGPRSLKQDEAVDYWNSRTRLK